MEHLKQRTNGEAKEDGAPSWCMRRALSAHQGSTVKALVRTAASHAKAGNYIKTPMGREHARCVVEAKLQPSPVHQEALRHASLSATQANTWQQMPGQLSAVLRAGQESFLRESMSLVVLHARYLSTSHKLDRPLAWAHLANKATIPTGRCAHRVPSTWRSVEHCARCARQTTIKTISHCH